MTLMPSSTPRWKAAMVTIRLRSATRATDASSASSLPTVSIAESTPPGGKLTDPLHQSVAVDHRLGAELTEVGVARSVCRTR